MVAVGPPRHERRAANERALLELSGPAGRAGNIGTLHGWRVGSECFVRVCAEGSDHMNVRCHLAETVVVAFTLQSAIGEVVENRTEHQSWK